MEDKNAASADDRLDQDEKSRQKRKGHSKNSSISERDRKIGHRRINEEGQVCSGNIQVQRLSEFSFRFRTKRSRRTSLWAPYNWVFMIVWVDWQSTQKGW